MPIFNFFLLVDQPARYFQRACGYYWGCQLVRRRRLVSLVAENFDLRLDARRHQGTVQPSLTELETA